MYTDNIQITKQLCVFVQKATTQPGSYKSLKIFHQNIRGLKYKTNELTSSLILDLPHLLCLVENYLSQIEMTDILIKNYNLGPY